MAVQLVGARRRGRRGYQRMADINVTPFVDVMLVLLIVFMVTAPLIIAGTALDLPPPGAQASARPDDRTIIVHVAANGDIRLGKRTQAIAPEMLVGEVRSLSGGDLAKPIVVLGERQASYGQVAAVLGPLSAAGFTGLALGRVEQADAPANGAPAPGGANAPAKAQKG